MYLEHGQGMSIAQQNISSGVMRSPTADNQGSRVANCVAKAQDKPTPVASQRFSQATVIPVAPSSIVWVRAFRGPRRLQVLLRLLIAPLMIVTVA